MVLRELRFVNIGGIVLKILLKTWAYALLGPPLTELTHFSAIVIKIADGQRQKNRRIIEEKTGVDTPYYGVLQCICMQKYLFESAIQKIARILAAQYHIQVIFEGNQAYTDGKKIILPQFENVTPEIYNDMIAFCDHEVSHCRYTDFPQVGKCVTRFHKELLNAVEDSRIEKEFIKDYPGAVTYLDALNTKYVGKMRERWSEFPYPVRLICAVRDIMEGKKPIIDADTKELIEAIAKDAKKLADCTSTEGLRIGTEKIAKLIEEKREEQEKQKEGGGKGEGKDEGKEEGKKEKSENGKNHEGREFETSGYIPFSTRFDKVTDHSGKGSVHNYASLKHEVKSIVAPIKHDLERILKVKENAKWRVERERGSVNSKSLSKLLTDRNYRTPFKEFHKVETNNVAVQLLVDMSGSMAGKIHIAQMAVVAMAEALKSLDIPFEVTGFHSTLSRELYAHTGARDDRFGRTQEMLDLHVFKRFDCPTLYAIEKIKSGHNNPDGECVVWAAKRLAERKEKRKILLVLSDGYPNTNDTDTTRLNQDLRLKVKNIIKSGIEVVGVGIATDAVRYFYPDFIVINELESLPKEAMKKLSKIVAK